MTKTNGMLRYLIVGLVVSVCAAAMDAHASNTIGFISTGANADPDIVTYLQSQGHTVMSLNPSSGNPAATQALADASDVVLISETIGSSSISNGGVFHLQNHPGTVVSWEPFMFDEAKWTGPTTFTDFGNTHRPEVPVELQGPQTDIFIVDASHPLAAGLGPGLVTVFNDEPPHSATYGVPGADADVIATADAAGNYPTLFMYHAGDQLFDGSVTPGNRVGFFFGQPGTESTPPAFSNYNANALALLNAVVSIPVPVPEPSSLMLVVAGFVVFLGRYALRGFTRP